MAGKSVPGAEDRAGSLVLRLEEQRNSLREVLQLAGKQRAAIARDDPGELLRVIAERDRVFAAIEANTKAIDELRADDDPVGSAGASMRLLLETRLCELATLAADVIEHDRVDTEAAVASRDRATAELTALSQGRRVNGAYGAGGRMAASFQDQEG